MSTYRICKAIRRRILSRAAEIMCHPDAPGDFRALPNIFLEENADIPRLEELTSAQMDDLGFGVWAEDSPIRLIPMWLHPFLPDEVYCVSMEGVKGFVKKSNMLIGHRCGYLTGYGVVPSR